MTLTLNGAGSLSDAGGPGGIFELVMAAFAGVDHDGREDVDIVVSTWERGATRVGEWPRSPFRLRRRPRLQL